jgi:hypothetical protein
MAVAMLKGYSKVALVQRNTWALEGRGEGKIWIKYEGNLDANEEIDGDVGRGELDRF